MGLKGVFNWLFGTKSGNTGSPHQNFSINIDASLGNSVLTGKSAFGIKKVLDAFVVDSYNSGKKIIVVKGNNSNYSTLNGCLAGRNNEVYLVDLANQGNNANALNLFDVLSPSEQIQAMGDLITRYCGLEARVKSAVSRYIQTIQTLRRGAVPKINEPIRFDIDTMDTLNQRYSAHDPDESRAIQRFLDSIRATDYFQIESAFSQIASSNLGKLLSGKDSLFNVFNNKEVVEITLDDSDEQGSIALLDVLHKYITRLTNGNNQFMLVLDGLSKELYRESTIKNILNSTAIQTVHTVPDIKGMINEIGGQWLENSNTVFFFRQTSPENATFVADKLGKYETYEVQTGRSVTKPDTFMGRVFGVYDRDKVSVTDNSTSTKVEKYFVRIEEISNLKDNEVIVYLSSKADFTWIAL